MQSFSGFLITIILLGAVQGFIAAGLLFFSARNRRPNRLLGWLILLFALACFNLYANHSDWFHSPVLRFLGVVIPTIIIMPIGPLIWFYVRSSLDPEFRLTRKLRLHFLPVIIDFVPSLTALIYLVGVLTYTFKNNPEPWGIFIDDYNMYSDIPRWISVVTYSLVAYRMAKRYQNAWLKQFTLIFLIFTGVWLIHLIPYLIPRYSNWLLDTVNWYPLYLPICFLIYWLGIKGFMISYATVKRSNGISNSLTDSTIRETAARLIQSMEEEKLYLNPALNLQLFSQHTGIPQKLISAVLNRHIHKSFNAFVNEYRIGAFKEKMRLADMDNLTMAGIAAECGFNSQATFQRAFKEFTGMSPSEFRKKMLYHR